MLSGLVGKVAVVTGAAGGLGAASALRLLREGCRVAVVDLDGPLRRAGTPDEIASVVAFLLSDEAAYMAGEVVSVDGGSAVVSTVRPFGGAGARDFGSLDARTYRQTN